MNTFFKTTLFSAATSLFLTGCGAPKLLSTPIANIDKLPLKTRSLSTDELKSWGSADLTTDTIPGMSINKAYAELLKNKKGVPVIVGVIDSGVDIEHEDLKNVIWTNKSEIPGNGKDDDNNGYVDDIHGWNFLGDIVSENLELTRIVRDENAKFSGKTLADIPAADRDAYATYTQAKAELAEKVTENTQNSSRYKGLLEQITTAHTAVAKALGKEDYTKKELQDFKPETTEMQQNVGGLLQMYSNLEDGQRIPDIISEINGAVEYFEGGLESHYNLNLDARKILGDNPNDIKDTKYGNGDVDGPDSDNKENTKHGTHVSGIIAAQRDNNVGMNGVANNAKIMVLRAVPDGDEYDKDIALAIRYATDNGAKVINGSFGKYYSTHPEWVRDAIKYAASKDVLIIKAAGNESKNLDENVVYPNDQIKLGDEISTNFLTVGALNHTYGSEMIAPFSNYGKDNVDVFAPGMKIWATTPNNTYEYLQGTSMAAPAVAGVAAIIRSYFPKLTAPQVKKILMDSGVQTTNTVMVAGDPSNTKKFPEISKSGKMVNLYNAFIMASKL